MKWIKIIFISLLLFFSLLPSISFYSIGERETKNQNDANTGKDAGNVIGEAFSVEEGVYKGTLEEKDIDWYRFNVGYDRIIKIRVLSSLTLYLKAELIDKNNEVKEVLNSEYSNKVRELVYNGGKGSWFLKIQSVSGNGFYSFSLYTKVNVKNLVAKVSYTSLFETTNDLVNFGTRFSFTTQCDRAANYIYSKFSSFGLKTEYDNFIYNGDYYGSRFQGSILKNVIATKPGKNNTNNAVYIISAHYDSRSENADSSLISAPGADDDASSVAAVIETARILSEYEFDSTIKFIAFSGEEQWLQGSEHYAKNAKNRGENIKGVINYDMVSYKNKVDIVGDEKSRALVEFMKNIKQKYGISAPFLNINFYAGEDVAHRYWGSDHTSFQKYGYPAVVGFEASLDPEIWHQRYNPNYHKTTDTVDKLNFELLSLVTKLTLASLAELAENKIDELLSTEDNIIPLDLGIPFYNFFTKDTLTQNYAILNKKFAGKDPLVIMLKPENEKIYDKIEFSAKVYKEVNKLEEVREVYQSPKGIIVIQSDVFSPTQNYHILIKVKCNSIAVKEYYSIAAYAEFEKVDENKIEQIAWSGNTAGKEGKLEKINEEKYYWLCLPPKKKINIKLNYIGANNETDFDLYVGLNSPYGTGLPRIYQFDYRGFTIDANETVPVKGSIGGYDKEVKIYIFVRAYQGSGNYNLIIREASYG